MAKFMCIRDTYRVRRACRIVEAHQNNDNCLPELKICPYTFLLWLDHARHSSVFCKTVLLIKTALANTGYRLNLIFRSRDLFENPEILDRISELFASKEFPRRRVTLHCTVVAHEHQTIGKQAEKFDVNLGIKLRLNISYTDLNFSVENLIAETSFLHQKPQDAGTLVKKTIFKPKIFSLLHFFNIRTFCYSAVETGGVEKSLKATEFAHQPHVFDLPPEILAKIFEYLLPIDLARLEWTCSYFRHLLVARFYPMRFKLIIAENIMPSTVMTSRKCAKLLLISPQKSRSASSFAVLFRHWLKTRYVNVSKLICLSRLPYYWDGAESVQIISSKVFPELREVIFCECDRRMRLEPAVSYAVQPLLALENLVKLEISNSRFYSDWLWNSGGKHLNQVITNNRHSLKEFVIKQVSFDVLGVLRRLILCPKLQKITICHSGNLHLYHGYPLPNPECLSLETFEFESSDTAQLNEEFLEIFEKMVLTIRNLKQLKLSSSSMDLLLMTFLSCNSIEKLTLISGFDGLSTSIFNHWIIENGNLLKELTVNNGSKKLGVSELKTVGTHCRNLKKLRADIEECSSAEITIRQWINRNHAMDCIELLHPAKSQHGLSAGFLNDLGEKIRLIIPHSDDVDIIPDWLGL